MPEVAVVGPWAKEKLDALRRYLEFYTTVLKRQPWRTIYVDAFAGGGRAIIRANEDGPSLFAIDGEADAGQQEIISGSPKVALDIANPFSRYVFIEPNSSRSNELLALRKEYGDRREIDVLRLNAADGISWVASQAISRATHRGVAFLDPFGTQLDWVSVERLAATGLFEVVVNFPLNMAINRMLPNSGIVPDRWRQTLDAYFGSSDWFEVVYQQQNGLIEPYYGKRSNYSSGLLKLYRDKLKAAFGHVSTPRIIRNTSGVPLYYLLWAGSHPKGLEGANYILQMGDRMSGNRGSKHGR